MLGQLPVHNKSVPVMGLLWYLAAHDPSTSPLHVRAVL